MRLAQYVRGPLVCSLAAVGLAGAVGCLSGLPLPPPEQVEPCRTVPRAARNHVYVFVLDLFDPTGCGELAGLRGYLIEVGFLQTYHGQAYHAGTFAREMKRLHKQDPEACFVVIGTGWGRLETTELLHAAHADKVPLQLVVQFHYDPRNVPSLGLDGDGPTRVWCVEGGPDPDTLQQLAWELTAIAGTVPLPVRPLPTLPGQLPPPPTPVPPDVEIAPPPRPLPAMPPADTGETWDALNPTAQLRTPPKYTLKAGPPRGKDAAPAKKAEPARWGPDAPPSP